MAIIWKRMTKEEKLLEEFDTRTKKATSDLQKIQDVLINGHVPGKNAIDAFHGSLNALRDQYNDISAMAKDKIPETERPPEGSTAKEYVTALISYKENELARLREKTISVLDRFSRVTSNDSAYNFFIGTYKQEATDTEILLRDPEEAASQFVDIEDYEKVLAPVETFLKALECEDLDSEEGIRLLDKVCEYYTVTIAGGIMNDKYYIYGA